MCVKIGHWGIMNPLTLTPEAGIHFVTFFSGANLSLSITTSGEHLFPRGNSAPRQPRGYNIMTAKSVKPLSSLRPHSSLVAKGGAGVQCPLRTLHSIASRGQPQYIPIKPIISLSVAPDNPRRSLVHIPTYSPAALTFNFRTVTRAFLNDH